MHTFGRSHALWTDFLQGQSLRGRSHRRRPTPAQHGQTVPSCTHVHYSTSVIFEDKNRVRVYAFVRVVRSAALARAQFASCKADQQQRQVSAGTPCDLITTSRQTNFQDITGGRVYMFTHQNSPSALNPDAASRLLYYMPACSVYNGWHMGCTGVDLGTATGRSGRVKAFQWVKLLSDAPQMVYPKAQQAAPAIRTVQITVISMDGPPIARTATIPWVPKALPAALLMS